MQKLVRRPSSLLTASLFLWLELTLPTFLVLNATRQVVPDSFYFLTQNLIAVVTMNLLIAIASSFSKVTSAHSLPRFLPPDADITDYD